MIRCIAIDDEPVALKILENWCLRYGKIELETFSIPRLGMERIWKVRPDVVFMDIEMNGISGIDLARQLPEDTCLIFTTAYAGYAVDSYDVNAVDFLHKPYFYARFEKAMRKAEKVLRAESLLSFSESATRSVLLKSRYRNVSVSFDKIVYAESMDNYLKVHLSDNTTVVSKYSISNLESKLPEGEFLRIHRSFIVAVKLVSSFTRSTVTLGNAGVTLPVGRKYAPSVESALKGRWGASGPLAGE